MNSAPVADFGLDTQDDVDFLYEIRLRTWARTNHVDANERDLSWHPVILDEMDRIDRGE